MVRDVTSRTCDVTFGVKIGHCVLSLYNIYIIYKIYTHNMSQLYHYPHVFERRPKEVMVGLEFHFLYSKA